MMVSNFPTLSHVCEELRLWSTASLNKRLQDSCHLCRHLCSACCGDEVVSWRKCWPWIFVSGLKPNQTLTSALTLST